MLVDIFIYWLVYLFVCLFICLFVGCLVGWFIYLFICWLVGWFIYLLVGWFIYLFVGLFVYLFICWLVGWFIYLLFIAIGFETSGPDAPRPFVPHINLWETCYFAKVPDDPQIYTLDVLWLQQGEDKASHSQRMWAEVFPLLHISYTVDCLTALCAVYTATCFDTFVSPSDYNQSLVKQHTLR